MTPTYTIKIITEFSGAHVLHGYDGPCSRLHGHNWKVEVEVATHTLDEIGMGMDFRLLKKATKEIAATLDHRNINEIPPFDKINPSAENIAAWFYEQLNNMITSKDVSLTTLTIWETDNSAVKYSLT